MKYQNGLPEKLAGFLFNSNVKTENVKTRSTKLALNVVCLLQNIEFRFHWQNKPDTKCLF